MGNISRKCGEREENPMDIKEYCSEMGETFAGWKDDLCDMMSAVDAFPENEKAALRTQISILHDLVEDMTEKMDRLQRECPLDAVAA